MRAEQARELTAAGKAELDEMFPIEVRSIVDHAIGYITKAAKRGKYEVLYWCKTIYCKNSNAVLAPAAKAELHKLGYCCGQESYGTEQISIPISWN